MEPRYDYITDNRWDISSKKAATNISFFALSIYYRDVSEVY